MLSTWRSELPAVPGTRCMLPEPPLKTPGTALPDWMLLLLPGVSWGTAVPTLPSASGSRILNWAIVRILRETQLAKILPRCFSPRRERGKSPFCTKATMSRTSWCSLSTVLTIMGTIDARKARVRDSAIRTRSEPAWKIAL